MAHNISFQKNEKGDFVSKQELPWHGFGTILQDNVTVQDALTFGGLDYVVEKSPNVHRMPSGMEIISDQSFFTWRTDTNVVLGAHVGSRYTCVQNGDALNIVEEFPYHIETAGVLKNGALSFICMKSDKSIVVGGNDVTEMYLLFTNSFDGSMPISVLFTPIRVVCNNTLNAALAGAKDKYTFRHTISAKDKIREFATVMGLLQKNTDGLEEAFNKMANTPMNLIDFIGHVYLTKEEITALAVGSAIDDEPAISTRKANIMRNALVYAEKGEGQKEWLNTGWGNYNAITGFMGNQAGEDEKMMEVIFGVNYRNITQKAGELALQPSAVTKIKGLEQALFN